MGAANCSSCGCDSEQEKQNTTNIKPHHQSAQGYAGGPSSPPMGGPRGFDEGLSKSNMPDHPSHGDYGLKDKSIGAFAHGESPVDAGGHLDNVAEANTEHQETRVERLQDGSVFEGQFRGRDRHGYGKFTWSGGGSYEGNFDANDMHGEGSYIWSDGSKYQGQWQRNNMGPFGIMIWTDGRRYEGQFRDGKKHGEGKLTWPDGRSYVGQWECGKQHGVGTTVTGRGVSRKSQWDHGKLVKWLDETGADSLGGTR